MIYVPKVLFFMFVSADTLVCFRFNASVKNIASLVKLKMLINKVALQLLGRKGVKLNWIFLNKKIFRKLTVADR